MSFRSMTSGVVATKVGGRVGGGGIIVLCVSTRASWFFLVWSREIPSSFFFSSFLFCSFALVPFILHSRREIRDSSTGSEEDVAGCPPTLWRVMFFFFLCVYVEGGWNRPESYRRCLRISHISLCVCESEPRYLGRYPTRLHDDGRAQYLWYAPDSLFRQWYGRR